jgi:outer membrane protein assembly factor BamB
MKNLPFLMASLLFISFNVKAQEILQFRGENRAGIYQESNLLKSWPPEGPPLMWEFAELGKGYGSPIITSKNIYVNGEIDSVSYLFCLDLNGKVLWKSPFGKEWMYNYPGSRSTPTLIGDLVYVTTGMGIVACLDAVTGKTKWSIDMVKDYHGKYNRFGYSESLLVEDNKVYCSPGGPDTNVVALDRFTGKQIWICKANDTLQSYCSPVLVKLPERNILMTFSKKYLLGIDTKNGILLWSHKQDHGDTHVNTPWFDNGYIYYVTGDGNHTVKLKLSNDGTKISEVWRNMSCDGSMGGFVVVNNYLFSASYYLPYYYSIDTRTGKTIDSLKFDRGITNYADGMLYFYNESGQLGLIHADEGKMEMVSSFKIRKGTKAHFAHPVICNGILYLRHGTSLLAYDIRNK